MLLPGAEDFTGGSDGKESACSEGDLGLMPGLGRSPGRGHGYSPQYSCLENPHGRAVWQPRVHRVAKSWHDWMTEHCPTEH